MFNQDTNRKVLLILPFPKQAVVNLFSGKEVYRNVISPRPLPAPTHRSRQRIIGIVHFFNEELLLPFWIQHHSPIFDECILIDYSSTDRSASIIERYAPSKWKRIASRNTYFDAQKVDREVEDYESLYPGDWKMALTVTEFLIHPDIHEFINSIPKNRSGNVFRFPSFAMIGNDSQPLQIGLPLPLQRSVYSLPPLAMYARFMHNIDRVQYDPGRHGINHDWTSAPKGFIAKFMWTPWPEIIDRKLSIGPRIPQTDKDKGFGAQHYTATRTSLHHGYITAVNGPKQSFSIRNATQPGPYDEHAATWCETIQGNLHIVW